MAALKDAGDGDPKQLIEKLDKDRFPEAFEYVKGTVWLVLAGTPTTTPSDLVDEIAPDDMDDEEWPYLFVAKVDSFNGVATDDLWDKLKAWREVSA